MSHKWKWFGDLDADCPKGKGVALNIVAEPVVKPAPRKDWPLAAQLLAKMAIGRDQGIGDVVQRLAATVPGVEDLAAMLGCSCADRHARWNQLYPLR
jgi:hypothetical protein